MAVSRAAISFSFEKCSLNYSSFYNKKIKKTNFKDCEVKEVDFSNCDLSASEFDNCDLNIATTIGNIRTIIAIYFFWRETNIRTIIAKEEKRKKYF